MTRRQMTVISVSLDGTGFVMVEAEHDDDSHITYRVGKADQPLVDSRIFITIETEAERLAGGK